MLRKRRGFLDLLRWKLTSRPEKSPSFISDVEQSIPPPRVEGTELRITLVNHSTVLLQQLGINILTDPIWSERASPVSWAGPRRQKKRREYPGNICRASILCCSATIIMTTWISRLCAGWRLREDSTFIVPVGCGSAASARRISGRLHELDWGDAFQLPGCTIHCVPALHFSGRGIHDRNKTLWCGYVIEIQEWRGVFRGRHSLRTAFRSRFGKSSDRRGWRLLPIGAY